MKEANLRRTLSISAAVGGLCGFLFVYLLKGGGSFFGIEGVFGSWLRGALAGGLGAAAFYFLAGAIFSPRAKIKAIFLGALVIEFALITVVDNYRLAYNAVVGIQPVSEFTVTVSNDISGSDGAWFDIDTRDPRQRDGTSRMHEVVNYYRRCADGHPTVTVVLRRHLWELDSARETAEADARSVERVEELRQELSSAGAEVSVETP